MVTLANVQGGSLVPNFLDPIKAFAGQAGQALQKASLQENLRIALGGAPADEEPSFGILNQIAPGIAQAVNKLRESFNPQETEEFRSETKKGVALSKEIMGLPNFAARRRRITDEAGKVASAGGDVRRLVQLSNMDENQLSLELQKMQVIGKQALKEVPAITESSSLNFLSTPARRNAFAAIAASSPQAASSLLNARNQMLSRRAKAARQSAKGVKIPKFQTDAGKALADQIRVDEMFGKGSEQSLAFAERVQAEIKGDEPKAKLSDVAGLRKEFTKQSGDFVIMRDSMGKIEAAAKRAGEGDSAASDLSMVFAYMKMLDPNSVVRESEFATAENARGVPEAIRNIYNKTVTGEFLSPQQRVDFLDTGREIFNTQMTKQRQLEKQFTGIAERQKMDFRNVVIDFVGLKPLSQIDLQEARQAISLGVSRDKILQRLRENGIDPTGL